MLRSRHPLRPVAWAFLALVPVPLLGLPLAGGGLAARLELGFAALLLFAALASFAATRKAP